MKAYVYPADDQGCGLHRLIWPTRRLKQLGYDVMLIRPSERGKFLKGQVDPSTNKLVDVIVPPDADVLVFQRVTHKYIVEAIPIIRERRGIAVVIDMDDDLAAIDPRNPAFQAMHPTRGRSREHSWHFAQAACDAATLVTVSTPSLLQRYARHNRGHVLYNHIPARYLNMPHDDDSTVVGWGGSVHSHPGDLQVTGFAVDRICEELGQRFQMVGPGEGVRNALSLHEDPDATGP